jgi:hypothetical protein
MNGMFIDRSITEIEMHTLWDVREAVFSFYGDKNRLPKSLDELIEFQEMSAHDYVAENPDADRQLVQLIIDKIKLAPQRLKSLEVSSDEEGPVKCKVAFIGAKDGKLHAYDPTTAEYPTNVE